MGLFKPTRRLRQKIAAFRDQRDGVSAVEFGIVAAPFMFLLFAIIETGYIFLLAFLLEGAAADGARQIRTGVVQNSGTPNATFEGLVCGAVGVMLDCATDISYDVRAYANIAAIDAGAALPTGQGTLNTATTTGNPGDIVVVRLVYDWRFITPYLENLLGTGPSDSRQLVASVVFRNELY